MNIFATTNSVIKKKIKSDQFVQKIAYKIAITLIPIQILAYSQVSYAIPQQATVTHLNPTSGNNVPSLRLGLGQRAFPAQTNQVVVLRTENNIPQQSMIVPLRSQANLRFNGPSSPLVQLGSSESQTEYLFPCAVRGGASIVGWRALPRSSRGCTTFTAHASTSGPISDGLRFPTVTAGKQLDPQTSPDLLFYCGTLEESGPGWGFHASSDGLNPCRQAEAECLETGSGNACSVSTTGAVSLNEPDILATIQCPNALPITNQGSAQDMVLNGLPELKRLARFTESDACVIDVYYPGDVVISPAKDELTLVQLQLNGNAIEVAALVGDVTIISVDRPRGLFLTEGSKYKSGQNQVALLDCSALLESDPIQTFLNPQVWSSQNDADSAQDTVKTLTDYQNEFCQSAVERPNAPSGPGPIRIPFPFPFPQTDPEPDPQSDPQSVPEPDSQSVPEPSLQSYQQYYPQFSPGRAR